MRRLVALIVLCLCGLTSENSYGEEFRIGIIAATTGDIAPIGQAFVNGARLAGEELSDNNLRVKIIAEDDGLLPAKSMSAYRKLTSADKIDAIIVFTSGSSKAVTPLVEKDRLPMIALGSDASIQRDKKYVYNFWITPEAQADALILEAEKRAIKKTAIVSTIQDGTLAFRDAFLTASKGKVDVVFDEEFAPKDLDFRGFIAKLANRKDIDAVVVSLMPGHLGAFAKQLRTGGVTVPIIGSETVESDSDIKASAGAMHGAWFATAASPDANFLNRYRAKFGETTWFSSNNAYDSVAMLVEGRRKSSSPEMIVQSIGETKNYKGASGVYSALPDHRFSIPVQLKVITSSGQSELLSSTP